MRRLQKSFSVIALFLFAVGCEQGEEVSRLIPVDDSPLFRELPPAASGRRFTETKYALLGGEYITTAESGQVGRFVYFKDVGNKQLAYDFVPGLSLDGTDAVSYYIDQKRPSDDISVSISSGAISRAMNTWEGVACSQPSIYEIPFNRRVSTGYVSALFGFRGSFDYVADVLHAGWLPGSFFDLLAQDGSTFILGVTFTIIFTDDNGNPVDTDGNGKYDVAWREIYYNDAFTWRDGAHYDIETIALHEAGHGLSQAHFGSAFLDAGSGELHFSPRAVMNAAYSGIQTQITETDNAGHCSNWSSWSEN
ncbi:MAG: hypothetical protein WEB30_07405 [Cyclobacteriaceae bacterium]